MDVIELERKNISNAIEYGVEYINAQPNTTPSDMAEHAVENLYWDDEDILATDLEAITDAIEDGIVAALAA